MPADFSNSDLCVYCGKNFFHNCTCELYKCSKPCCTAMADYRYGSPNSLALCQKHTIEEMDHRDLESVESARKRLVGHNED